MRLDAADWARTDSPSGDPRGRIVAALLYVLVVAVTPPTWSRLLIIEAVVLAFAAGWADVAPVRLIKRWLAVFLVAGPLALVVAVSHPARAELGYLGIMAALLAKNALAIMALAVLSAKLPLFRLAAGLRGLGMPAVLVCALQFMCRHLMILGEEMERMALARRARSFGRFGINWRMRTGLIGALVVRSLERGERQHAAMLARGWDGRPRWLEPDEGRGG